MKQTKHTLQKLRVGLLLDTTTAPVWQYSMLRSIDRSHYADLTLAVMNDGANTKEHWRTAIVNAWRRLLYVFYCKIDTLLFRVSPDAFENKNVQDLLAKLHVMHVKPMSHDGADVIQDTDIQEIGKYHIDVFIQLGFRALKGHILQSSRFGIWSIGHPNNINNTCVPGFWEMYSNNPTITTSLQMLTDPSHNARILCRSYCATDRTSLNRNHNRYFWKSQCFIPRKLKALYR